MKRIFLILLVLFTTYYAQAQIKAPQVLDYQRAQFKPQQLIFLVSIDREISQDVIEGEFAIKGSNGEQITELPFHVWVGRLEMNNQDYKKLLNIGSQDTLYVRFANNNFQLHTDYIYQVKIPNGMISNKYLILKIYNQKNEESRKRYVFPNGQEYVIQVVSPGFNTPLELLKNK